MTGKHGGEPHTATLVSSTLRAFATRTEESRSYLSAKRSPALSITDTTAQIDMGQLRAYRLKRLQQALSDAGCAGALLFDPINVRYACGSRNMAVWLLHNQGRYCFVPAEGKVVLFEYPNANCREMARGIDVIGEIRPAKAWAFFFSGEHQEKAVSAWADEVASLLWERAGSERRLAVDRLDPLGIMALSQHGLILADGQAICERARAVKSPEEIVCMSAAMAACDVGMARMRAALEPGVTENKLWALLHQANIELGGEWIETRLLSSGGRTNPWFQESSDRVIKPGDLVSFDTDMIGPFGYCCDVSRTFHCGPGRPTADQRTLYGLAAEQIHHNLQLIRPGMSFREIGEAAWRVPQRFAEQKYSSIAHGVGLCDEWPVIAYRDVGRSAQDGILEPGMTICLESYIGEPGGAEGVKLEEQVLVTETGCELLSSFPYEDAFVS
jgi:Xaa-Pro dipeptidase